MAEVDSMHKTDESESKLSKQKGRIFASLLVLGALSGGVIGYIKGNADERHHNRVDLERVAQDKACLAVVLKNTKPGTKIAEVRYTALSEQERKDCDVLSPIDTSNSNVDQANTDTPLGAELSQVTVDGNVTLPTQDRLQADIEHHLSGAADFNHAIAREEAAVGVPLGALGVAAGGVLVDILLTLG